MFQSVHFDMYSGVSTLMSISVWCIWYIFQPVNFGTSFSPSILMHVSVSHCCLVTTCHSFCMSDCECWTRPRTDCRVCHLSMRTRTWTKCRSSISRVTPSLTVPWVSSQGTHASSSSTLLTMTSSTCVTGECYSLVVSPVYTIICWIYLF